MKVSELRLGNAILYRGEKLCKVSNIGNIFQTTYFHTDFLNGSDDIRDYEGIPLSIKEMGKLGFVYSNRQYRMPRHVLKDKTRYSFVLNFADDIELWHGKQFMERISDKQFKYVHEIQNIWFELTGEELTYKID